MIKSTKNLNMKGTYLNTVKVINDKTVFTIMLNKNAQQMQFLNV